MKIIISRKGFDSKAGGIASPIMPDGTLLSIPIPSADGISYSNLNYKNEAYSRIIGDLGYKDSKGKCHVDPDIRPNIRINADKGWNPAFGQMDTAQRYLQNAGVEKDDLFLFFGWFRRVELKDDKYNYIPKSKNDFYLGNAMHIVYAYLQVGEIITDSDLIEKYSWHPHADKSRLVNKTNALYIPREKLSLDDKLPGYGVLNFHSKRVLTKMGYTPAIWNEHPFLMPEMVIGNRKNSAKEEGLYYKGQWQELVLKENEEAINWALRVIS